MATKNVKLVVFVPLSHSDAVRKALGEAGAGRIGNYDFCSFSSLGTGRFRGNTKSNKICIMYIIKKRARIAQPVRALHSHCRGPWFESRCAHHFYVY